MRLKKKQYNVIDNNCQGFAEALLELIQQGSHRKFATTLDVWKKTMGDMRDLDDKPSLKDLIDEHEARAPPTNEHAQVMQTARALINDNTNKIDEHSHAQRSCWRRCC
jgi:hypothetical protein